MTRYLVTGGNSGIGAAFIEALEDYPYAWRDAEIVIWDRQNGVDVSDPESVWAAVQKEQEKSNEPFDVVVQCAGVNYINWLPDIPYSEWDRVMNTNARGLFTVVKELLLAEMLKKGGTVCNIISNASHVPMTHSAAYNASKGAAHILTLQMARELGKTDNLTVFGLSPNKIAGTQMSDYIEGRVCELRGWTPEEARKYQLAALPAGEETSPKVVGSFLANLLSRKENHKYLAGCILPYGA